MKNKDFIIKFKDNAELAMASYGYFDRLQWNIEANNNIQIKKRMEKFRTQYAKLHNLDIKKDKDIIQNTEVTLLDILNVEYNNVLGGDFSPTQAKRFFEKYDMLIHQPNTHSGFSATLFQNKESKEYTLALRGTEDKNDLLADKDLALGKIPKTQYLDMLLFYYQCIGKIPFYVTSESKPKGQDTSFMCDTLDIKCSHSIEYKLWEKIYIQSTQSEYKPYIAESLLKDSSLPTTSNFTPPIDSTTKLTITGHSLGGCLAQLFALSFAKGSDKDSKPKDSNASTTESNQDSIINEVYTFNSPGAKNLKPPYDVIIYIPSITDSAMEKFLLHSFAETLTQEALALHLVIPENNFKQKVKEILNNTSNADTYLGINFYYNNNEQGTLNFNYEKVDKYFLSSYQTLIHNYNNRNEKNYKLDISDKVFHIESKNQADKYHHAKESYKENAAQHLGKDIEGNYFLLNLNFGGLDSHKISSMAKILYFYTYLYEVNESLIDTTSKDVKIEYELHQDEFLKEHNEIDTQEYGEHKKALEYCNRISLAINTILRNIELQKALAISSNDDVYIPKTPNWLYAIIEQRVFEATIKTQENKFLIKEDTSNIIEAILYLQQNKVYIQILEEDTIKNITPDSPLSQLFAIQESSFFISTDENANPLIKDTHTANRLIGYRTPRAKIFCGHHKADTILVNCYKGVTLKHYPKAINE